MKRVFFRHKKVCRLFYKKVKPLFFGTEKRAEFFEAHENSAQKKVCQLFSAARESATTFFAAHKSAPTFFAAHKRAGTDSAVISLQTEEKLQNDLHCWLHVTVRVPCLTFPCRDFGQGWKSSAMT